MADEERWVVEEWSCPWHWTAPHDGGGVWAPAKPNDAECGAVVQRREDRPGEYRCAAGHEWLEV